jgi:hypothetical protein
MIFTHYPRIFLRIKTRFVPLKFYFLGITHHGTKPWLTLHTKTIIRAAKKRLTEANVRARQSKKMRDREDLRMAGEQGLLVSSITHLENKAKV